MTMSLQKHIFIFGRPGGEGVLYERPWIFGHPETVQSFQHTFLSITSAKVDIFVYGEYQAIIVWISW
jgi:hypothetical protein